MALLIPCCSSRSFVFFTSKGEVILDIVSWSLIACSFKLNCLFSWFLHIIYDWNVDDWCVVTWFFRSDWFSWFYWLTWFAWIFWIWQVWFVAWNIWNDWLTWFSWIIWIVWILHFWCWWEVWIVWCLWFWNQFSKWVVSNSFFKIFLSDCLSFNTCFISVVTWQSWCLNCIIVSLIRYPWFIRVKNCTCHLIKF